MQFIAKLVSFFTLGKPRSGKWQALSKKFLYGKTCAVCGIDKKLVAHHKRPFHEHPDMELDESNLIALCQYPGRNCHFVFGHLWNWQTVNSDIDDTIDYFNKLRENAKKTSAKQD